MPWEDIYRLPVQDITADNCALFLWTVPPFMPKCLKTIDEWGFRFITKAFTWVKIDKKNEYRLLPVYYTGSNSEDCYLGVKGKMQVKHKGVKQVIATTLREHSKKPEETRDRIVELCGDVKRIELFASENSEGWDSWGAELFEDLLERRKINIMLETYERRTEIKRGEIWQPYDFTKLKKGDIFRLFDDGKDPIETGTPYIATSDVFINDAHITSIKTEPFNGQ